MQSKIYSEDKGTAFGKWSDKISKLMYFESTKDILSKINTKGIIADYGGANGIIKQFIPSAISIDIDKSKKPDIVDNIITHRGKYDLIIIRFVLHYLNDYEVLQLFKNIKSFHKGRILVIQFCNDNLKSKYQNSVNEFKYFRTQDQLESLLPKYEKKIYSIEYDIDENFYLNRLGSGVYTKHKEKLNAYLI